MVSTRKGVKFSVGEKVLCYEPDPLKARVLYQAKVLKVQWDTDVHGKKTVGYHIHFLGWNNTYDRTVSEDYLLKQTAENQKLLEHLAAEGDLRFGTYLYRKENKRKATNLSERVFEAGNSCSSLDEPEYLTTDDDKESSIDTDYSLEQNVPFDLSSGIRTMLEKDFHLVKQMNKLVKLPVSPNVVEILEEYVRYYTNRICKREDEECGKLPKRQTSPQPRPTDKADEFEWICANYRLCREMADGLRITFDYHLQSHLLYESEQAQYEEWQNGAREYIPSIKSEEVVVEEKIKTEDSLMCGTVGGSCAPRDDTDRRRSLRSHKDPVAEQNSSTSAAVNGAASVKNLAVSAVAGSGVNHCSGRSSSSTCSYYGPLSSHPAGFHGGGVVTPEVAKIISKTQQWRLVNESYTDRRPPYPSLIYGAAHLARLFVKIPSILYAAGAAKREEYSDKKMKILLHHLSMFVTFLEQKVEWFSEDRYC